MDTYKRERREVLRRYDDKSLMELAASRLAELRAEGLSDAELLRIGTSGELSDEGYRLTSSTVTLRSVAREEPFS